MIKCLCFLLLVVASQAFVTREVQKTQKSTISRPEFTRQSFFVVPGSNDMGFTVSWNAVPSNTVDPVLGYRLIVTEEIAPNTNQLRIFQDIYVHGADKTIAAVARQAVDVWYYYRVQAFTRNGFGELSLQWGNKILPSRNGERTPTYKVFLYLKEAR